jgi:hypothetical protein
MKILEPFFKKVIFQLIESNVKFILIGGYAVNYHGYGRYTGDMDFWLKPTNENKLMFIDALEKLGKHPDDLNSIRKLNFTEVQTISMGIPPLRIDFLTKVNLVDFEKAWTEKQEFSVENYLVPVINYFHLIETKIASHRTKDKLDVEELQKINKK